MQDPGRLGSYSMFPNFSDGSRTVEGAHYDDQRDPARDDATPFIQSAVVSGPYLRLIVPYQPDGDTNALRRNCPGASALAGDARATVLLACLQRVHAVTIDGSPLPSPRYELGSDARTDRPALVAMIDVRSLVPGRHELEVAHAPEGGDRKDAGKRWQIPFWR